MRTGLLSVLISLGTLATMAELSIESSSGRPDQQNASHEFVTRRVSQSVIAGPTPHGVEAMRQLRRLGVRTLVSVDGARPDVESAEAEGMTYVHLPAGYDGLSPDVVAGLTRVMQEWEHPVYVHCHHGKHRGPAAAAICSMIAGELDSDQAVRFLQIAGTSHDYSGLWESVRTFEPFPDETPLPELRSFAEVEPLVDAMVRIDARFDELQSLVDGDETHTDDSPRSRATQSRSVARILYQELREASRLLTSGQPADFIKLFEKSVRQAEQISQEIDSQPLVTPPTLARLRQTCAECHNQYRN